MRTSNTALSTGAISTPAQSLGSLSQQLEQLRAAHADAKRSVASSQIVFDTEGSDESMRALRRAREAEQDASEYVARLERLLAADEAEHAAAERAKVEHEIAALRAELATDPIGLQLQSKVIDALSAAADALVAVREHQVARGAKRTKANSLSMSIGGSDVFPFSYSETVEPNFAVIAEQVRARAAGLPSDSPRCRYLHLLAQAKAF